MSSARNDEVNRDGWEEDMSGHWEICMWCGYRGTSYNVGLGGKKRGMRGFRILKLFVSRAYFL